MKRSTKIFWTVNFLGWLFFVIVNIALQSITKSPILLNIIASFTALLLGLFLTGIYRKLIHKWNWIHFKPIKLLVPAILASLLISLIWTLLLLSSVWLISSFFVEEEIFTLRTFLGNFVSGQLIFIIWSAFYFAYQFFQKYNLASVEKWKLEATVKDAQLGILKSQLNPHFMFNALNNIRALILEDKDKARDMITSLSDLLRYSFTYTNKTKVSLKEEIENVESYFQLTSIQYERKLDYLITLKPDIENLKIPPMIIQMLVENSIKHGIANLLGNGKVEVDVKKNNSDILITVTNTGKLNLKTKEEHSGVGLENIRKRLELLYGNKSSLEISENDNLVTAKINLPIDESNNN